MKIHFTEKQEWIDRVLVLGVVDFEGIAPIGQWVAWSGSGWDGDARDGGSCKIGGVVFSAHRCLCVVDADYHDGWSDRGTGAVLEAATEIGLHNRGPGGPLRVQPPPQSISNMEAIPRAVGMDIFTLEPEGQDVIFRAYVWRNNRIHRLEWETPTYDAEALAFSGILMAEPILAVEIDVTRESLHSYLMVDNVMWGMRRE